VKFSFQLLLLLLLICGIASAQNISMTLPDKVAGHSYDHVVLGKTEEGILVYRYNKYVNKILCYDETMSKRWERDAQLDKHVDIFHISLRNNEVVMFFTMQSPTNNIEYVCQQSFTAEIKPKGPFIKIDSVLHERWTDPTYWYVKMDEAKKWYALFRYDNTRNDQAIIHGVLLSDNGQVVRHMNKALSGGERSIQDEFVDLDGNFYISFAEHDAEKELYSRFRVDAYLMRQDMWKEKVLWNKGFLVSPLMKYDALHHQLWLVGFESALNAGAQSFFTGRYQLADPSWFADTMVLPVEQSEPLNTETKKAWSLYTLKNIVFRFDGAAIVVGEHKYTTSQVVEVPSYYNNGYPTYKTYTYLHYDEMQVWGIAQDMRVQWTQNLAKKQESSGDEGVNSSYALVKGKDKLMLLYNEEVAEQTNVMAYSIKADGTIVRGCVLNTRGRSVFLQPKKGRQVSLYEEVIPSEYNGYFQLVKIDF
jgi:hypothetical protein